MFWGADSGDTSLVGLLLSLALQSLVVIAAYFGLRRPHKLREIRQIAYWSTFYCVVMFASVYFAISFWFENQGAEAFAERVYDDRLNAFDIQIGTMRDKLQNLQDEIQSLQELSKQKAKAERPPCNSSASYSQTCLNWNKGYGRGPAWALRKHQQQQFRTYKDDLSDEVENRLTSWWRKKKPDLNVGLGSTSDGSEIVAKSKQLQQAANEYYSRLQVIADLSLFGALKKHKKWTQEGYPEGRAPYTANDIQTCDGVADVSQAYDKSTGLTCGDSDIIDAIDKILQKRQEIKAIERVTIETFDPTNGPDVLRKVGEAFGNQLSGFLGSNSDANVDEGGGGAVSSTSPVKLTEPEFAMPIAIALFVEICIVSLTKAFVGLAPFAIRGEYVMRLADLYLQLRDAAYRWYDKQGWFGPVIASHKTVPLDGRLTLDEITDVVREFLQEVCCDGNMRRYFLIPMLEEDEVPELSERGEQFIQCLSEVKGILDRYGVLDGPFPPKDDVEGFTFDYVKRRFDLGDHDIVSGLRAEQYVVKEWVLDVLVQGQRQVDMHEFEKRGLSGVVAAVENHVKEGAVRWDIDGVLRDEISNDPSNNLLALHVRSRWFPDRENYIFHAHSRADQYCLEKLGASGYVETRQRRFGLGGVMVHVVLNDSGEEFVHGRIEGE